MKTILLLVFLSSNLFSGFLFNENRNYDEKKSLEGNGLEGNGLISTGSTGSGSVFTGLEQTSSTIPGGFYLGQNLPAYSGQVTNIYFSLPYSQHVKLVVFNMLGQEVDELISSDMKAGTYKFSYDGSKLTSGVYVYRLQSEGFTDSKKLLLVK